MPGTESKEFVYPSIDGEYLFVGNTLRNDPAEPVFIGDKLINPPDNFVYSDQDSGSSPYVAKAVHFDGALQGGGPTYLSINSLASTDNGYCSFSMWVKNLVVDANQSGYIMISDPDGSYTNPVNVFGSAPAGFGVEFDGEANDIDASYSPFGSGNLWQHILVSGDGSRGSGNNQLVLYLNDVIQTASFENTSGDAFTILYNALKFVFGDDSFGDGPSFDCSDVWIAPGLSLLAGGSTILEATRRLFISADGKPVNPSGFPSSAILFSGDSSTFQVNQGTGGAFTLTGSLTNASTSPSD